MYSHKTGGDASKMQHVCGKGKLTNDLVENSERRDNLEDPVVGTEYQNAAYSTRA